MGIPGNAAVSCRTVLLVDDEELLRRMLARTLADGGFRVLEAGNGKTALEAADQFDGTLTLVVTDINMPVMDGVEFARSFAPKHANTPILFITGGQPHTTDLVIPPGLNGDLLRKPFGPTVFMEAVARMIATGAHAKLTSA